MPSAVRVANAPLSYGAFEVTVGVYPNVPGPEELLAEMAEASYAGTELGPPGYLGEGPELRERLERHGLGMAGGFVPIHFSEPDKWEEDSGGLDRTLELFAAVGDPGARPVLADAGPGRVASPAAGRTCARSGSTTGWRRLAEGVKRAEERSRERGFEPTFHHHGATYVEAPWEIERLMELTDVGVLLDTGHCCWGAATRSPHCGSGVADQPRARQGRAPGRAGRGRRGARRHDRGVARGVFCPSARATSTCRPSSPPWPSPATRAGWWSSRIASRARTSRCRSRRPTRCTTAPGCEPTPGSDGASVETDSMTLVVNVGLDAWPRERM